MSICFEENVDRNVSDSERSYGNHLSGLKNCIAGNKEKAKSVEKFREI